MLLEVLKAGMHTNNIDDTIKKLVDTKDAVELHGYTSAVGDNSVREAIANNINKEHNANINPNLIYMTCGAAASLTITLNAVLNEGEEVIVIAPFFPEYRVFIEKAGGVVKVVKSNEEDFQLDFEALEKAISKNTKAIIINSPNNPSGVILSEDTIIKLGELLNKKQEEIGHEIYLIADEPYRKLAYGGVQAGLLEKNVSWIGLFIGLAPMLGFMGTVIGMIEAFDRIQQAGDISATVVAGGIKVALITTVTGLIVAIILQIFYNFILSRIESNVADMEDSSITMLDILMKYNVKK